MHWYLSEYFHIRKQLIHKGQSQIFFLPAYKYEQMHFYDLGRGWVTVILWVHGANFEVYSCTKSFKECMLIDKVWGVHLKSIWNPQAGDEWEKNLRPPNFYVITLILFLYPMEDFGPSNCTSLVIFFSFGLPTTIFFHEHSPPPTHTHVPVSILPPWGSQIE